MFKRLSTHIAVVTCPFQHFDADAVADVHALVRRVFAYRHDMADALVASNEVFLDWDWVLILPDSKIGMANTSMRELDEALTWQKLVR